MRIILKINEDNNIKLSLFEGKKEKDSLEWKDENSLSRVLLSKIDQILKKNKIGLDKISGYKIISDVPENWTSARIAEITLKSLALAKKNRL
jgi:tRNA A37 threonylcarbamoyladenosine modification protein TsaB